MVTQTINLRNVILLTVFTLLALTLFSGNVSAQENTQSEETNTSSAQYVPETYRYTAEECNNATLLVRKSLQLYDQANDEVELSEAQIIFAETNVVQDMNASDLILVGENVEVSGDLIAKYARESQGLSNSAVNAWQTYANNADFTLEDVEANNVTVAQNDDGTSTVVERDEETGETANNTSSTDTDANADENSSETDATADSEDSSVVPWLLGAAAIIALWYLLWQRGGEEE